ncbi:MAG: NUDIX hydrolase [Anaerolineae bacterium]|nr:NUDIX hydrolase [Anaerolineae bacterium]MDW8298179.1 NUDIX hydrolase [Anaerolineae bacterium]
MSLERLIAALRQMTQAVESDADLPSAYRDALCDLLVGLGVLEKDRRTFSTPIARAFVQSLSCCLEEGVLTSAAWRGAPEEPCSGIGALLTQTLERHRRVCSAQPQPLRVVRTAMAIIKARRNDEDVYLMQYDAPARQFQLLGGKREMTDESSAATLVRELREELGMDDLTPERDFTLSLLLDSVREMSVSESAHVLSAYEHSFYQLLNVRFQVTETDITRWLTMDELLSGRTHDGRRVSRLIANHLAELLPTLRYSLSAITV